MLVIDSDKTEISGEEYYGIQREPVLLHLGTGYPCSAGI